MATRRTSASQHPVDWLYYDIETDGDPWTGNSIVAFGYHYRGETQVLRGKNDKRAGTLGMLLRDEHIPKVSFTLYDPRFLRLGGVTINGPIHNPQVMAHVLNENQDFSLAKLVSKYLGRDMDKRIVRRGGEPWFTTDSGELVPLRDAPWDQMERYNRDDVDQLVALTGELVAQLHATAWWDYYIDEAQPLTDVLAGMEAAGMPIDLKEASYLRHQLAEEKQQIDYALHNGPHTAGLPASFNTNSNDQVSAYLFGRAVTQHDSLAWGKDAIECYKSCVSGEHDDCDITWEDDREPYTHGPYHVKDLVPQGFTVEAVGHDLLHGFWTFKGRGLTKTEPRRDPKTGKKGTKPSVTTPDLLVKHGTDPWVQDLVQYRKRQKVISTYLDVYPKVAHDGRLYARFNQTATVTGRLSSSEPNLQNQPAHGDIGPRIRGLFKGELVIADYSQLEPRLMAHFSQDPLLLDVYRTGKDVYVETAKLILGHEPDKLERSFIKTVFLGSQYGAGPEKVRDLLALNGHPTPLDRVVELLKLQEDALHTLFEWKRGIMAYAKHKGFVTTLAGRRRRLKHKFGEKWNWREVQRGERQAVNAVIQGSAGDVVARTMVAWPRFVDNQWRNFDGNVLTLLFQVHDELGWESRILHSEALLGDPQSRVESALVGLQDAGESGHSFDLSVPLVFEPVLAKSWAEKETGWDWQPDEDEEAAKG